MRAGKKPGPEKEAFRIRLPIDLALAVKLALADPVRGRIRYGSINLLFERLLRDWLEAESGPPGLDSGVATGHNGDDNTATKEPPR